MAISVGATALTGALSRSSARSVAATASASTVESGAPEASAASQASYLRARPMLSIVDMVRVCPIVLALSRTKSRGPVDFFRAPLSPYFPLQVTRNGFDLQVSAHE